jgi:hypothetical protein
VAAVGLYDGKARTSLCELDPATGKLTEFLELPTDGIIDVGLAWHEGQLWVSYHSGGAGKPGVHLARVKVALR